MHPTTFWLLALALVAFLAVGCSARSPEPVPEPTPTFEEPRAIATPEPVESRRVPAPMLAIMPQPAPQSGQVRLSGSGFESHESITIVVTRKADAASDMLALTTLLASEVGSFDAEGLLLPDELQSGPHRIEAVGESSSQRGGGTLWIRAPQPWLVLDKYDVPQYGDLGLIAGGFEPMDQVHVSLQSDNGERASVRLASLTTDQAGNAQWLQVKLPRLSAGTYEMVLRGDANAVELRRELRVTLLKPVVELSPWAGPPGVSVQLNAKGFAPNERIRVSVGGSRDAAAEPLRADEWGNLWGAGPVRMPQNAPPGSVLLDVVGDDSGASARPEFKVLEPKPWLELTTWSGAPGAPVGFGGGGWIGGERIAIHFDTAHNPVQTTGIADDNGWLKGTPEVYIPTSVDDDDVIFVAVGEQSQLVAAATFKVVYPFGLRPQSGSRSGDEGSRSGGVP
jgi:hypothetical protein